MKKVFISQPMNGKTNEQIYKERKELTKKLEQRGYDIIDSVIADSPDEACRAPVYYLSESIRLLSKADVVFFMDDWEKARGCKIEFLVAQEYNLPILTKKDLM